jgi:hypothetical protein
MPRLFIDVDDTLVLYTERKAGPNPLGLERDMNFSVNTELIDAIMLWCRHNPNGQVVVWSGGGAAYARSAGDRFIPGVAAWYFSKGGKNLTLPNQDDLLVDDSPTELGLGDVDAPVLLPEEFIEFMNS